MLLKQAIPTSKVISFFEDIPIRLAKRDKPPEGAVFYIIPLYIFTKEVFMGISDQTRERLMEFCKSNGIIALYLFGSYARNEATP